MYQLANYKMIAALAVKRGELDRKEIRRVPGQNTDLQDGHRHRDISHQEYHM